MDKQFDFSVEVSGMTCGHCVNEVKNAIQSVNGVDSVEISLNDKKAYIRGTSSARNAIINAVEEAGFQAR